MSIRRSDELRYTCRNPWRATAAGAARNPAWYYNIASHPGEIQIEVDGHTIPVAAEQLHGLERDEAWQRITAAAWASACMFAVRRVVTRRRVSRLADEVRFAADLFRGTAAAYERYRLPYPAVMIADLARSGQVTGRGRLLDLACGTGQLAFALRRWFAEVWAVDQEPDMVEVAAAKAATAQAPNFRPVVSSAETLSAQPEYFELVVIGNAFHRLDRDLAAGRIFSWLQPGGHLALCWSSQPWNAEQSWQRAMAAALERWKAALGAGHRIPAGWEEARSRRPDSRVLTDAGFELAASREFVIEHRWTLPGLAGLIRSTSFLPAAVLGDQAAEFDADLAASLGHHSHDGAFTDTVTFSYELARKPG